MKKIIFGLMWLAVGWSILWTLRYIELSSFSDIDQKLYIITANLKYLTAIAFYIAWRVTPESKQ